MRLTESNMKLNCILGKIYYRQKLQQQIHAKNLKNVEIRENIFISFRFEWRIDGSNDFYEDWQAILYPLQDDVADNVVKQMLNLAPPSDGSYDVECISYQTFQDATITQGANVTFEVNSSSTDDKVRFFELKKICQNMQG